MNSTTAATEIDAAMSAAIAHGKRPEGIVDMLRSLALNENSAAHVSAGAANVLGHIANRVGNLLAADDPYAALGRLTVEMYLVDSQHWGQTFPTAMVAAIEAMCTAEVDDDGILQHPGETCPVCDAKVGEGQA